MFKLTNKGAGMSFLHTSSNGTPNFTLNRKNKINKDTLKSNKNSNPFHVM